MCLEVRADNGKKSWIIETVLCRLEYLEKKKFLIQMQDNDFSDKKGKYSFLSQLC